jgi:GTP-binding protein LepA
VGYLIAGSKDVGEARSGETITTAAHGATEALAGYQDPKSMVFCGLYPVDGDELPDLRDALEKLILNDASFTFEPESSKALGIGFRCGFLGLLHMEIVRERLEREFDLSLIATAPSVAYRAFLTDGTQIEVEEPHQGLRQPGLRAPGLRHRQSGPGRYLDQSRPVRRLLDHRA